MKNFFKNIFKKKYPERVEEKRGRTGHVYAGPEQMRNRKSMQCVYAGPPDSSRTVGKSEIREVYAGPPKTLRTIRDSEMEDVYAGPPDDPEPTEEETDI